MGPLPVPSAEMMVRLPFNLFTAKTFSLTALSVTRIWSLLSTVMPFVFNSWGPVPTVALHGLIQSQFSGKQHGPYQAKGEFFLTT